MEEYWEEAVDFPGYMVSDLGRVSNYKTGRILKISDNGSGSLIVNLQRNRRPVVKQVRWLVAEIFLEPPVLLDSVPQHKNRKYKNCAASNLEWMSKSDVMWRKYQEEQGYFPDNVPIKIKDTGEIFRNIFDCARHIGGFAKNIDKSTRNSEYTYKGLQFEYLDKRIFEE